MSTSSLELVIKAANGLIPDFKIDSQPTWTILQVKNYIYRHYPTHPPLSSQRLIHGGHMLMDDQPLSQLSSLTAVRPIVIHLVAYERSQSAPVLSKSTPSSVIGDSGSRDRGRSDRRSGGSHQDAAERGPSLSPIQEGVDGEVGVTDRDRASSTQRQPLAPHPQDPWLHYRGVGGHPFPGLMYPHPVAAAAGRVGGGVGPAPFFPQMMVPRGEGGAFGPPHMYNPVYANHMAQYWHNYYRSPTSHQGSDTESVTVGGVTGEGGEVVEDLDLQDLVNNRDDEADQAVPMNVGGFGLMAGGLGGVRHHHDLVDYMYMSTMIGFLALIAYLTGSLGRLMVFAGGILFMLLNQRGWFTFGRRRQVQQDAVEENPLELHARQQQEQQNREEVQGQESDNDLHQQEGERDVQPQEETTDSSPSLDHPDSDDNTNTPSDSHPTPSQLSDEQVNPHTQPSPPVQPAAQQADHPQQFPPRPGLIATIVTFVISFFTSLLPQQRPDFRVN